MRCNQRLLLFPPKKLFFFFCNVYLAKNPPGIFSILDDVCSTMHAVGTESGIDVKFLEKCGQVHNTDK